LSAWSFASSFTMIFCCSYRFRVFFFAVFSVHGDLEML
jgi:hypothetical protein